MGFVAMYLLLILSSPPGIPIMYMLFLLSLYHSSWIFCSGLFCLFLKSFFLFPFQFLEASNKIHLKFKYSFSKLYPVYQQAHQMPSSFPITAFLISNIFILFFLRISFSLPTLPICSCTLPAYLFGSP